jgi:hypothetical protein
MNHAESNADDCSLQALDHPPIPRVGHQQRGRTAVLCDLSALNAFPLETPLTMRWKAVELIYLLA